ncbi:uncharacterized SAM-binding protein YcdF (DUF218 family) [Sporomusaceae bacterium BoRhaA]|uniref:YdcF family protein n=1 Tax=Pelorhabdus rhamnosifermentans TaxID=2772457 RepID=UPI001C0635C8|nr:YdcF family protein [Pelorhabdus rhamnosifermentans]MBU2702860.1 uncharacterized SAM-binding protein YcdF (DUF218 family) [Pelorhabdus rhamnosifermentans]
MFYLIKFLYTAVILPPGIFILLLAALSVWSWRKKQPVSKFLVFITVIFYVCSTGIMSNSAIRFLESQYVPSSEVTGDVIIMLGGGATLDTPNIEGKGHLSGFAANRLLTAAQLYYKLKIPIIVSGGRVFETTGKEAEIARATLLQLGVPADHIIIEDQSTNTTENARFSKEKIQQYHFEQPILVTSAFHMPRAVKQFEKVGVTVQAFPTDYQTNVQGNWDFRQWWPTADGLYNLSLAIKEYVGLIVVRWY